MSELAQLVGDDHFSVTSLTEAINKIPAVRGYLGKKGLFATGSISTTTVSIEIKNGLLAILSSKTRSAGAVENTREGDRKLISMQVPHYPVQSTIDADEVLNLREFGQAKGSPRAIAQLIAEKQAEHMAYFEATWEYLRLNALKGRVEDVVAGTMHNLYSLMGIAEPSTITIDLTETSDNGTIKKAANALVRSVSKQVGSTDPVKVHALCGSDFFDALSVHPEVKAAYDRWQNGEQLRDGAKGFVFAGIEWSNYIGGIGNAEFMGANEVRCYPETPGLFKTKYAPANFIEAANTLGKPTYTQRAFAEFDTGVIIKSQTNPISYCTRPEVLRSLTGTLS